MIQSSEIIAAHQSDVSIRLHRIFSLLFTYAHEDLNATASPNQKHKSLPYLLMLEHASCLALKPYLV